MVCLVLFFLVIVTVINQIYELRTLLTEEKQQQPNRTVAEQAAHYKKPISQWQLFGHERKNAVPLNNTKWVLKGVILGVNGKNNLAIIASSDQDEAFYQAGDTLADGAIITAVLADRVLLSLNGFKESLLLWDQSDKTVNADEEQQAPLGGFED